jgi:hypothetical protein
MNPAEIPPWSTVASRHGVLFVPLCQFGGNLYGWTAYIQARDDQQADAEFRDRRWIKTLGLPYDRYRPLVEHIPGPVDAYQKIDGRVFHLRFRIPGLAGWFDPRFHTVDLFTANLLAGDHQSLGVDDARTVTVTEDRDGLFNPARYMLSDGSMLLSYRLGHAALFRTGDRLRLPELPCTRFADQLVRLVLGYEHIDFQRSTP